MADRLFRSRDDRMIAGVAGGVAEQIDADPSIIRIVWAVLMVLTGGLALLVYVVMAILIGLGGMFLVRQIVPAFDVGLLWPGLLIGLGLLLVIVALAPRRPSS